MKIITAISIFAGLAGAVSAGTVVDAAAGFQALSANLDPARAAAVDSDTERTYSWSASSALYDGGVAGTRIFGGVSITTVSNLTHAGVGTTVGILSGANELRASVGNNSCLLYTSPSPRDS